MAKARAIAKRRKAVQNIRKITRTMQLIATARFQAAFKRATATKPYTEGIARLAGQLAAGQAGLDHPLMRVNTQSGRCRVMVLTSNRGLCGGYNGAVLRTAMAAIRSAEAAGRAVEVYAAGRKGIAYFRFLNRPLAWSSTAFEDRPRFAEVEALATEMMEAYRRGEIDAALVVYMRFVSAGLQEPTVLQLLPLERPAAADGGQGPAAGVQYDFSPPAEDLLAELLPQTVKVRLFQCFTDAAVSEQTARMVAMKAATDAASDMIRSLSQQYNRARQTQITLELLDIVGGAEGLK